jgi:hypothetical protein
VVVTVGQDKVWLSISPPFTWEAIMEPAKVDELMHVLELATDEARKMAVERSGRAPHGGKPVVRAITSGPERGMSNSPGYSSTGAIGRLDASTVDRP